MTIAELVAEHGSPLWLVRTDDVRTALADVRAAFRAVWPDTEVAYSYKTNRTIDILRALHEEGAPAEVVCGAEYAIARDVVGVAGDRIVVNGPAKTAALLQRAAADDALVVLDSADELERAAAVGVRRLGVRVAVPGALGAATRFGIPAADTAAVARRARRLGARVEVLAVHLVSTDLTAPPDVTTPLAAAVRVSWPRPPADHARAAALLGGLAAELASDGCPVDAVDLGGGFPGPPETAGHARAVAAALGATGFTGRLLVEPGRALVAAHVDLVCSVIAVKSLDDGRRVLVVDAGGNLVPGVLWTWPRLEAVDTERPPAPGPAMVAGPLCLNTDVLHPAAALPELFPGDLVVARAAGAYQQVQSTQFGDARPAVLARDHGPWRLVRPRETTEELVGLPAAATAAVHSMQEERS